MEPYMDVTVSDQRWVDHVPIACKDAIAILIISDLTRRQEQAQIP
ncbi:hypothetical protein DsansV1_C06g0063891 [Dioscorea sansibarensis]